MIEHLYEKENVYKLKKKIYRYFAKEKGKELKR